MKKGLIWNATGWTLHAIAWALIGYCVTGLLLGCGGDAPPIDDGGGNTETRFAPMIVDETPDETVFTMRGDLILGDPDAPGAISIDSPIETPESTFTMRGGDFELIPIEPAEGRLILEPPLE